MRRTIRRENLPPNRAKREALADLCSRYGAEKERFLVLLSDLDRFGAIAGERQERDQLVAEGYASPNGLQDRMWKRALKDAYETVEKWLLSSASMIEPKVRRRDRWIQQEKRFAFWVLRSARRIALLLRGKEIGGPSWATISREARSAILVRLRRDLRKGLGKPPRVRQSSSVSFDDCMYRTFEENGRQYIALMSLERGERIVLPLLGTTGIHGDVRLVLRGEKAWIHYSTLVQPKPRALGPARGIDTGLNEVLTDDRGKQYGKGFGDLLARLSCVHKEKGRKRGKLHALARQGKDPSKSRRIRKNNLGGRKRERRLRRAQAEVERQINTALRTFFGERQPSIFAREILDFRGKAKSKEMSRRIVAMRVGALQERIDFLASAGGSRREKVNPAYSSQACPKCDFVHPKNRAEDRFACLHCGCDSHADRVGGYNLKRRIGDPEIHPWTPRSRVKAILLERFSRRSGKPPDWKPERGTVPGRMTPGTGLPPQMDTKAEAPKGATCGSADGSSAVCSSRPRRSTGERNGHGNPGISRSKIVAKRTRSRRRKQV